ncbi:SGNH/GDSL hydrolase family protein [Pseudomonas sp. NPDC089554]|uniref:SGNH/GDSL hydrolase family protein n=1 Tax=Pseudomonas sp. NPDC089554 TaxID=3390653 RepID=UPI003CFFF595
MKDTILLLTDSLALGRKQPEALLLDDTWAFLLRSKLPNFEWLQLSLGGATSSDLLAQSEYWLSSRRTVSWLIIQVGIVDCAPRAFSRNEIIQQKALGLFTRFFPRCGKWIFERLRKYRKVSYVKADVFRENVRAFRDVARERDIGLLWIPVLGAKFYERLLPGVTQRITETNDILRQELGASVLDVSLADECYMVDGHHLRQETHGYLAHAILKHIEQGRTP